LSRFGTTWRASRGAAASRSTFGGTGQ
jgi:hypothetical protein